MLEGAPASRDHSEEENVEKANPLTADEKLAKLFPGAKPGIRLTTDSHGVVHTVESDEDAIEIHKQDLAA